MRSAGVKGCVLGELEAASSSIVSISWKNWLRNVHDALVQPRKEDVIPSFSSWCC